MVAIIKATSNLVFLAFSPLLLPLFLVRQAWDNERMAWIWEQSLWHDFWESMTK